MSVSTSFCDYLHDQFIEFGPITIRKMFGGAGVYKDGLMFGLIADDVLYLKADAALAERFRDEGMGPFVFTAANGKTGAMGYWQAPDRLFDEPETLARWADRSHHVAVAAKRAKRVKPKASKKSAKKTGTKKPAR